MKKMLLLAMIISALAGCTDAETTTRALKGAGYSDIQTQGYSFFGCGRGDTFHTEFSAKGPTGQPVNGVVCNGWLKGATIRTE